jgi:hypothetical protein
MLNAKQEFMNSVWLVPNKLKPEKSTFHTVPPYRKGEE